MTHHILAVSGSLRGGSTNTAVVRTAQALAKEMAVVVYDRLGQLPHFNPDDDVEPLPPEVAQMRRALGAAEALLLSTPEYAGGLPGSFKNFLDWTVGGGTYGMPVAWINASASPTGAADAHHSLRTILVRTGTVIVEAACAHVPVPRDAIGSDGLIGLPSLRQQLREVLSALGHHLDDHPRDQATRPQQRLPPT